MLYFKLIIIYCIIIITFKIISEKFNLFDYPKDRKIHKTKIINTSGICLYIYFLIIVGFFELSPKLETVIVYGAVISIFGFIDDRINLSPGIKLFLTFFPILYLVQSGFVLENLGVYEFIGKVELGKLSFLFTILACGLLMNSYNYTDGVDGLLLIITLTNIIFAIILIIDDYLLVKLFTLLSIPIIINLILNILPNKYSFKMFMGDSGSLFLGFFISFLLIFLFKFKNIHPSILIWMVWYPIYDFLYVSIARIKMKKKFYVADNIHFHHKILFLFKKNHLKTTLFISLINITVLCLGYFISEKVGKIYSLSMFIILFFSFYFIRTYFDKNKIN